MNNRYLYPNILALGLTGIAAVFQLAMAASPVPNYEWSTVVNNGVATPCTTTTPPCRKFNSYNQPSVNANGLVVFRARSKGGQGGEPEHGVYLRDMASGDPLVKILDRNTRVPQPNNRDTVFIEPPSFPRIDIGSNTIATRGNHQPVWKVLDENGEIVEQLGTTGIYTNPFGDLITGASKLGPVPDFSFFEVPEAPGTPFDVFPGAPAVTDANTIVFKGNYTVNGVSKTGVYYRTLRDEPILLEDMVTALATAGGDLPVVLIANNTSTRIPGTETVFGSTAPPSAANGMAVFAGFDNEDDPTLGGIYLAPLTGPEPPLKTLVSIGSQVPGESRNDRFNKLGEGVSFDGRFVAFWGAWGTETRTLVLQCPTEGNRDRIAFCNEQYPDGFSVQVPVHQGIFVHDIQTKITFPVAKTPKDFDDLVFWNFSGRVPGATGEGDDDGEPARWRSSAFTAVSGAVKRGLVDATFHVAFKARTGDVVQGAYVNPVDGIYLRQGPGLSGIVTLVQTGMDGTILDPEAVFDDDENPDTPPVPLPVTEMGIERDGFRNGHLVINASMGTEESGWAGIYMAVLK